MADELEPPVNRLGMSAAEFSELAMRLRAKQPQLRAIAQRLLAARVVINSVEEPLRDATSKLLEAGEIPPAKLKDQFLSMRRVKEDAERTADFYKAAGNALSSLFLSPLPQQKHADAAGKRMIELGDEWEKCRSTNRPRADYIRLLLRDLSYTIFSLPLTPPADGMGADQRRELLMSEAMGRAKVQTLQTQIPFDTGNGIIYRSLEQAQAEAAQQAGQKLAPMPGQPSRRPLSAVVYSPPPSIASAPRSRASGAGIKPDRAEMVRQMAVQSARTRRITPAIRPIPPAGKTKSSKSKSSARKPAAKKKKPERGA